MDSIYLERQAILNQADTLMSHLAVKPCNIGALLIR
jgi:hypothetical protein